ncbi:hypothetical protein [Caudoviricetes sp.]|nr:hypothetical protein [Caudoviricetes sp.]
MADHDNYFFTGSVEGIGGFGLDEYDSIYGTVIVPPIIKDWSVSCIIGGVDVSALISGSCRIERDRNAAATMTIQLIPAPGEVDPFAYVNKLIVFAVIDNDTSVDYVIYRGKVNTPVFDAANRLLTLSCSDKYQEIVKRLTIPEIDALIPGYSPNLLYSGFPTRYDYAVARLDAAEGDLFLDIDRAPTYVPWLGNDRLMVYNDSQFFNGSLIPQLFDVSSIVNTVTVSFGHRFELGWQRYWNIVWDIGEGDTYWMANGQSSLPQKQQIIDACPYPVDLATITYRELPETGTYILPISGLPYNFTNGDPEHLTCMGAEFQCLQQWRQSVTNTYTLTLTCQASVDVFGAIPDEITYNVDTSPPEATFNDSPDEFIAPLDGAANFETQANANELTYVSMLYDPAKPMASVVEAAQYVLSKERKKLLEVHRSSTVSLTSTINPIAQLGDHLQVDSALLTSVGVVGSIIHELSIPDQYAVTTLSTNVFLPSVSGQIDDIIDAPDSIWAWPAIDGIVPDITITPQPVDFLAPETHLGYFETPVEDDPEWVGYIGNRADVVVGGVGLVVDNQVYDKRFRLVVPEVPDADRDARDLASTDSYNIAIPEDQLTLL